MAYASLSDVESRLSRDLIDNLSKPVSAVTVVGALTTSVSATMDIYRISGWPTDAKLDCCVALTIEGLYARHGSGKVPAVHSRLANHWRDRLEDVGMKEILYVEHAIAYEPALDETDDELDTLLNGPT